MDRPRRRRYLVASPIQSDRCAVCSAAHGESVSIVYILRVDPVPVWEKAPDRTEIRGSDSHIGFGPDFYTTGCVEQGKRYPVACVHACY